MAESAEKYLENTSLNLANYFEHVVGVTVNQQELPEEVVLFINRENAPYVLTKPIHQSQQLLEKTRNGIIINLKVQLNFELEREILGFGDCIKVLKPERLKRRIYDKARHTTELYESELKLVELGSSLLKVKKRGFAILENIYTTKEVGRMLSMITRATADQDCFRRTEDLFAIRRLLHELPNLKEVLFNRNLGTLVKEGFGKDYFLTKAIYFDKPPQSNWYVTWHQDIPINVKEKIDTAGFRGWTNKAGLISVIPPWNIYNRLIPSAFTWMIPMKRTVL